MAAVRALRSHWLPTRKSGRCLRGGRRRPATPEEMEAAAAARRRQEQQQQRGAAEDGGRSLSGQSYWLDLWLFVLFDLALFVVIYLLP